MQPLQVTTRPPHANMTRTSFLIVVAAAVSPINAYKFMAIGDWGASYENTDCTGTLSQQQKADATAMGNYASANNVSFTLLLGDNFYGSGVHGDCHSCRFQKTFEDIYDASSLEEMPFYAIAGNHDHLGNVTAQIEYSKISKRWVYPDWYYSFVKSFNDGGENVTMEFILIDTVLLDVVEKPDGTRVHGPLSDDPGSAVPADAPTKQQQLDWLEMTMKASTADYLWVGGHYPVWSGCSHGNTAELHDDLKPLLEKYHATGYMSGHDHCEEFIDDGTGPVYLITGSGFECCYDSKNVHTVPANSMKFAYWDGDCPDGASCPPKSPNTAFTVFTVTKENMVLDIIDSAGKTLFTTKALSPRPSHARRAQQ